MTEDEITAIAGRRFPYLPDERLRRLALELATEWAEAAEPVLRAKVAAEIRAVAADPDRRRPLRRDAQVRTDVANDLEWAAMIAEGES